MKSALLVVLLAAAASAAVVSNEVPDVVELHDVDEVLDQAKVPDSDEVADVDENESPEVIVTEEDEIMDAAALNAEVEEPLQTAVDTRRNLNQGTISAKDVRVLKGKYKAKGIAGELIMKTLTVSTNRRISAVWVNRVGSSQGADPSIIGGGIGCSFVTIRIISAVGRGYYYKIQIYAR